MKDILLDTSGAPVIENGDLVIGLSDQQHQTHLLLTRKGEYKHYPEIGVGLMDLYDEENPKALLVEVKRQFEYDGMRVDQVKLQSKGKLIVNVRYK